MHTILQEYMYFCPNIDVYIAKFISELFITEFRVPDKRE